MIFVWGYVCMYVRVCVFGRIEIGLWISSIHIVFLVSGKMDHKNEIKSIFIVVLCVRARNIAQQRLNTSSQCLLLYITKP